MSASVFIAFLTEYGIVISVTLSTLALVAGLFLGAFFWFRHRRKKRTLIEYKFLGGCASEQEKRWRRHNMNANKPVKVQFRIWWNKFKRSIRQVIADMRHATLATHSEIISTFKQEKKKEVTAEELAQASLDIYKNTKTWESEDDKVRREHYARFKNNANELQNSDGISTLWTPRHLQGKPLDKPADEYLGKEPEETIS